MSLKLFLAGLTIIVKHLCRYYTIHQAAIVKNLHNSSLTAEQVNICLLWLAGTSAVCTILENLTGY